MENSPNLVNYEDIENAYQEDTAALMLAAAENHFNEYSDQSSSMPTDLIMAIRDEDQRHQILDYSSQLLNYKEQKWLIKSAEKLV